MRKSYPIPTKSDDSHIYDEIGVGFRNHSMKYSSVHRDINVALYGDQLTHSTSSHRDENDLGNGDHLMNVQGIKQEKNDAYNIQVNHRQSDLNESEIDVSGNDYENTTFFFNEVTLRRDRQSDIHENNSGSDYENVEVYLNTFNIKQEENVAYNVHVNHQSEIRGSNSKESRIDDETYI